MKYSVYRFFGEQTLRIVGAQAMVCRAQDHKHTHSQSNMGREGPSKRTVVYKAQGHNRKVPRTTDCFETDCSLQLGKKHYIITWL